MIQTLISSESNESKIDFGFPMNLLSNGISKPQIILSLHLGIIGREGRD